MRGEHGTKPFYFKYLKKKSPSGENHAWIEFYEVNEMRVPAPKAKAGTFAKSGKQSTVFQLNFATHFFLAQNIILKEAHSKSAHRRRKSGDRRVLEAKAGKRYGKWRYAKNSKGGGKSKGIVGKAGGGDAKASSSSSSSPANANAKATTTTEPENDLVVYYTKNLRKGKRVLILFFKKK